MSQQSCTEFFAKINTDAALQQEVGAASEGKKDMEAAQAFVWVGAKHGYEFTATEAAQKYQEIIAAASGELDEEALENVAGGNGKAPQKQPPQKPTPSQSNKNSSPMGPNQGTSSPNR